MSNKEISVDVIDKKGTKLNDINVLSNDHFQFRINKKGFLEMKTYSKDWMYVPEDLRSNLVITINQLRKFAYLDGFEIPNNYEMILDDFKKFLVSGIAKQIFKRKPGEIGISRNYLIINRSKDIEITGDVCDIELEDTNVNDKYLLDLLLDEFQGYENVIMTIFRWDIENCPFTPDISIIGPLDPFYSEYTSTCFKECFNKDEIKQLEEYLSSILNIISLNKRQPTGEYGPYALGKNNYQTSYFPIYELDGYSLPFKIVGCYDLKIT